ncbi:unnamed protein product, partial [Mesorhabditis spiculigera]
MQHDGQKARERQKTSSRSNVAVLAIAQGLFTAAIAIDLTLTGLTGYQLAPDKSLATLPFALITVAGAIATYFASTLMQKIGRRRGFVLGAFTCAIGGSISVWAVFLNSFWLFCIGTAAVGIFQAFAQYYRLAATDSEPDDRKARAISLVLAGGVIAAILGPLLASWSTHLFDTLFAGSYLMVCLLGIASAALLWLGYEDALPESLELHGHEQPPRKLLTIFRQPVSLAALANNVIGGVVMMFIMTATPLAAVASNHSINDGASIIQWHLVGTIRMRARFDNTDGAMVPGLYARVKVGGSEPYAALLIDDAAIGTDQDKRFVLVVGKDDHIVYRPVALGNLQGNDRIITSGLEEGERVVVGGIQRVRPGEQVLGKIIPQSDAQARNAH